MLYCGVRDRSHYPVRKTSLADQDTDGSLARVSPAERVAMVWTITVQAWQFKDPSFRESRLRRDVVRIVRGGG